MPHILGWTPGRVEEFRKEVVRLYRTEAYQKLITNANTTANEAMNNAVATIAPNYTGFTTTYPTRCHIAILRNNIGYARTMDIVRSAYGLSPLSDTDKIRVDAEQESRL
jgi:hypothetical protein